MFYIAALIYLALGRTTSFISSPHDASAWDIGATFLFVHGWFPSAINKVVPGGWSIAAESMFYCLFPAIIALVHRKNNLLLALIGSYFLSALTNWVLVHFGDGSLRPMAMQFWLCQLPAFLGGCWLATNYDRCIPGRNRLRILAIFTVLALILDSQLRRHSNLLVSIVLLTALVWIISRMDSCFIRSTAMTFLGKISFSLYLVQFCLLDILRPFAHKTEVALGPFPAFIVIYAIALCAGGVVATLTYRYIEQPFIALGRSWKQLFPFQGRLAGSRSD